MKNKLSVHCTTCHQQVVRLLWGFLLSAIFGWIGVAFAVEDPQATIRQFPTHFFAGEPVSRTLLLESLPESTTPRMLVWYLMALNAPIAQGTIAVPDTGGIAEVEITFILPDLQRRTQMHLLAHITFGKGEKADVLDQKLIVYPRESTLSTAALMGKRIGVLDSSDRLLKILQSLGAKAELLHGQDWVYSFDGDAVIVGSGALDKAGMQERFFEKLTDAESIFPILILPQLTSDAAGLGENGQVGEIAVPGHSVFYTLSDEDMAGWQTDGMLGIPQEPRLNIGAYRALLTDGSNVAWRKGALILEQNILPDRHLIWCQLPLDMRWNSEPVCRILMINMLTYLLDPQEKVPLRRVLPSFYGDEQVPWLSETAFALTGLDPRFDSSPIDNEQPLASTGVAIIDAGYDSVKRITDTQPDFFEALEPWVTRGGDAYVFGLGEDDVGLFAWALGEKAQIKSLGTALLKKSDPLNPILWGISNGDLAIWSKDASGVTGFYPDPQSDSWTVLLDPPVMADLKVGKGCLTFMGFQPPGDRESIRRYWMTLLMNQGIMIVMRNNN